MCERACAKVSVRARDRSPARKVLKLAYFTMTDWSSSTTTTTTTHTSTQPTTHRQPRFRQAWHESIPEVIEWLTSMTQDGSAPSESPRPHLPSPHPPPSLSREERVGRSVPRRVSEPPGERTGRLTGDVEVLRVFRGSADGEP